MGVRFLFNFFLISYIAIGQNDYIEYIPNTKQKLPMIYVKGGNFFQRDVAYDVASFCYNELIPRIRKCEIEINIKDL